MNKTSLVLTVLGDDRPGLVESIARLVAEHGGNWLESRMAHLAGQFAGILRVEVEADQADRLAEALRGLSAAGLELLMRPDVAGSSDDRPLVQLELVGQDRPGIVREISSVLASLGVNVEELNTERHAAPTTGQLLFRATAELRLPSGLTEQRLRTALEAVAHDLMVDISVAPPAA
ncbi:MAG: glycine cleavage system protein R [Planctomycetota bacterium]|nr:MAG: glycine cleavage system protein R [Planctomycetota bacterium]